jgi:hypothetical protein
MGISRCEYLRVSELLSRVNITTFMVFRVEALTWALIIDHLTKHVLVLEKNKVVQTIHV